MSATIQTVPTPGRTQTGESRPPAVLSTVPIGSTRLEEDEIEAAVSVMRSGNLRQGEVCREFEERYAARVGAGYGVAVSSGTAALHAALASAIEPGDEVIVPTFSFIATATSVLHAGGTVRFADIDLASYTMDPADVERRITPRTRAIVPVHLYGNAADVDALDALAGAYGLRVIWDAAQAHGTQLRGVDIGRFGDAACYSFYPSKNMTTGEGGMVTSSDPEMVETMRLVRAHGESAKYYHTRVGYNFRMTDIEAAIGLKQLERLDGFLAARRRNARRLSEELADVESIVLPAVRHDVAHSFHQFTIRLDLDRLTCNRDEFAGALADLGIQTGVHYPRIISHQPVFSGHAAEAYPNAERAADSVLSLPVHPHLTDGQLTRVVDAVRETTRRYAR